MSLSLLGYEKNYFLTLKQANQLGASVKKDEKAHIVVYWNFIDEEKNGGNANSNCKLNGKRRTPLLRYYKVFNVAQCENIPENLLVPVTREAYPIPSCEKIIAEMPQSSSIRHKDQRAYYHPLSDFVNTPKKESFKSDVSYYATLFHELVHSTGHHSRLNRITLIQMTEFGSEPYSHEELVAEMGASYLESLPGIFEKEAEQNVAYIQGWISKLKNDKCFVLTASSHAQKAVDFILNVKFEGKEAAEEKDDAQPLRCHENNPKLGHIHLCRAFFYLIFASQEKFNGMIKGQSGKKCKVSGRYYCKTHQAETILIQKDDTFPRCSYQGDSHEATWILYIQY